ncbi:MAG: FkbM family methyltransferase [Thiotrichaceae bacterium]
MKTENTTVYVPHIGWLEFFPNDDVSLFLSEGWFEFKELAFLNLFLRPGDIVIDGGAHVGLYSILAGGILQGAGNILSIEPAPITADLLRTNLTNNKVQNYTVLETALHSENGKLPLHIMSPDKSAYDSLLPDSSHPTHTIDVVVSKLDTILEKQNIRRVDFLKLDLEGTEIEALVGAKSSIRSGKLPLIMVEFTELNLRRGRHNTAELRQTIEDAGYELCNFNIETQKVEPFIDKNPIWYDNLFAVKCILDVNTRLSTASSKQKEIANDIILRGKSAKELKDKNDQLQKDVSNLEATTLQLETKRADLASTLEKISARLEAEKAALASTLEKISTRLEAEKAALASTLEKTSTQFEAEKTALTSALEKTSTQFAAEKTALISTLEKTSTQFAAEKTALTSALEKTSTQFAAEKTALTSTLEKTSTQFAAEKAALTSTLEKTSINLEKESITSNKYLNLLQHAHQQHQLAEARIDHELLCRWPLRLATKYRLIQLPLWSKLRSHRNSNVAEKIKHQLAKSAASMGNKIDSEKMDSCQLDVSVVLCTYNPKPDLLNWALQSIANQTLAAEQYEIIIVDNNSHPSIDLTNYPITQVMPIKVVNETRQGLIFARLAGIRASSADLIVFVDDDNHLDLTYLENALAISVAEPKIGLFGGISHSCLERKIPNWKMKLLPYVGVRNNGHNVITSSDPFWGPWEPVGAGMAARREVANAYVEFVDNNPASGGLGRQGNALFSCEDSLFARVANQEGYACSYQPTLTLEHFILSGRLRSSYLFRLIRDLGRSYVRLEQILGRSDALHPCSRKEIIARFFYKLSCEGISGVFVWAWNIGYRTEMKTSMTTDDTS